MSFAWLVGAVTMTTPPDEHTRYCVEDPFVVGMFIDGFASVAAFGHLRLSLRALAMPS
jgi:hypothetical protein